MYVCMCAEYFARDHFWYLIYEIPVRSNTSSSNRSSHPWEFGSPLLEEMAPLGVSSK